MLGLHESQASLDSEKLPSVSTAVFTLSLLPALSRPSAGFADPQLTPARVLRPRLLSILLYSSSWAWSCQQFSLPISEIFRNDRRRMRPHWCLSIAFTFLRLFFLLNAFPLFLAKRFTLVRLLILHLIDDDDEDDDCFASPLLRNVLPPLLPMPGVDEYTPPRRFGVTALVVCLRFFKAGVFLIIFRNCIVDLLFGWAMRLLRFSLRSHILIQIWCDAFEWWLTAIETWSI